LPGLVTKLLEMVHGIWFPSDAPETQPRNEGGRLTAHPRPESAYLARDR